MRFEVEQASRGLSAIAELLVHSVAENKDEKPNSITLAGSKLVADRFEHVGDQLRTSVKPAILMEFGFNAS